jgi:hypothetical protein
MLQSISTEQIRVLGAFDPAACVVDFRESNLEHGSRPSGAEELIESVDATLLAHEFSHFLQMTSTIGGLIHHRDSMNQMFAMLQVFGIAFHIDDPVMLPINRHLGRFADNPAFTRSYEVLRDSILGAVSHFGGNGCSSTTESRYWLAWEPFGFTDSTLSDSRRWKAVLKEANGRRRWIHLGYQQVAEGAAKAVELLREDLQSEFPSGRNAPYFAEALTESAQPYMIAYYAYLNKSKRRGRRHRTNASLLEFLTLADLAMSIDFLLLGKQFGRSPSWLQAHLARSPSNAFGLLLDLVDAVADHSLAMPLGHLSQDAITAFQGAALTALCGAEANLRELAEATLSAAEKIFQKQDESPFSSLSPALHEAIKTTTRRELNFKVEHREGGPTFTFALWPDEDLRWMFVRSVPSFSNRSFLAARADSELARDALESRMIVPTVRSALFGDETCILAQGRSRACLVAEQPLCAGLKNLASAHKCGRQIIGNQLMETLPSRVDWMA